MPIAQLLADLWAGVRRPVVRRDFPMTWVADGVLLVAGPTQSVPVDCDRGAAAWVRGIDGSRTTTEILTGIAELPRDMADAVGRLVRTAAACGITDDAAVQPDGWRWMSPPQRQLLEPDLLAAHHVYGSASAARRVVDRRIETTVAVAGSGAVAAVARQIVLESGMRLERSASADVTLLCETSPPEVVAEFGTAEQRRPHLSIAVFGARALIGPLVVPGQSSCLRCAHLHHCDADTGWSLRSAQLALLSPSLSIAPVDRLLAHAAATLAIGLVRSWVDNTAKRAPADGCSPAGPHPSRAASWALDTAYELRLPTLMPRTLARPPHPLCGCQWPAD